MPREEYQPKKIFERQNTSKHRKELVFQFLLFSHMLDNFLKSLTGIWLADPQSYAKIAHT